ncbi:hypothetical protein SARC_15443, partial [Sphaeroforma arctica JP610]
LFSICTQWLTSVRKKTDSKVRRRRCRGGCRNCCPLSSRRWMSSATLHTLMCTCLSQ